MRQRQRRLSPPKNPFTRRYNSLLQRRPRRSPSSGRLPSLKQPLHNALSFSQNMGKKVPSRGTNSMLFLDPFPTCNSILGTNNSIIYIPPLSSSTDRRSAAKHSTTLNLNSSLAETPLQRIRITHTNTNNPIHPTQAIICLARKRISLICAHRTLRPNPTLKYSPRLPMRLWITHHSTVLACRHFERICSSITTLPGLTVVD